jgi:hypothetical protein
MRFGPTTHATVLTTAVFLLATTGCGGSSKYDPEPYRQQIEALETILAKPTAEMGDGSKVYGFVAEIARDLGATIDNARQKETVKSLLLDYGQLLSDGEAGGYPFDAAEARARWQTLRDGLFQRADWFQ